MHAADTLGFLVGAPVRVYAEGASRFVVEPPMTSQPNVAGYTARFAGRDGASDAVVAVGYGMIGPVPGTPLGEEQWFFGCERGVAEVTGPFDNLQRLRWAERRREAPVHEEVWPDADPFLGELAHFVECVREGRAPRANGAAGRQAVAFCLAVKESIHTGAPVRLEGGE